MSKKKKQTKQDAGEKAKATNAETKDESAGETDVMTCSCCGNELETTLRERACVPLMDEEAEHLQELVDALDAGELRDRTHFLFEASLALNLPEIAGLIVHFIQSLAKDGATAEKAA